MSSVTKPITKFLRKCSNDGKSYPLLDRHWIDASQYALFRSLEADDPLDEVELWISETSELISQYSSLLLLEFDRFWCELIYKNSLILSLDNFIRLCPRSRQCSFMSLRCISLIEQLKTLVLFIVLRSSNSSNSRGLYLEDSEYADLIYEHFVFDAPRLIDFAVLYSPSHRDTVVEVLKIVCTRQPKYISDLVSTLLASSMVLKKKLDTIQNWQFNFEHQPVSLEEGAITELEKMIEYISELGTTLGIFLSVCPDSCKEVIDQCVQARLPIRLAEYYDSMIPILRGEILRNMNWSYGQKKSLLQRLSMASAALIKSVRVGLIEPGILHELMHLAFAIDPSPIRSKSISEIVRFFLDMMLEFHNYKNFAAAYSLLYSIDDDLNLISETANSNDIDEKSVDYIRQAFTSLSVESTMDQIDSVKSETVPPPLTQLLNGYDEQGNHFRSSQSNIPYSEREAEEDNQPGPSRPPAFALIKSILPNIDDALIDRCLAHYNGSADSVVEALLEDTVPPEVKNPKLTKKKSKISTSIDDTSTIDLAVAAATSIVTLQPHQLWQGKRSRNELPPLPNAVREKTKDLCVSVYDDDNDEFWFPCKSSDIHVEKLDPYEDEYNDTYDMEVTVPERATNELFETSSSALRKKPTTSFSHPPTTSKQNSSGISTTDRSDVRLLNRGDDGSDACDPISTPPRTVLRIENPELVRERRQAFLEQRAFRKGPVVASRPSEIAPQPLPSNGDFLVCQYASRGSTRSSNQRGISRAFSKGNAPHRGRGGFSRSGDWSHENPSQSQLQQVHPSDRSGFAPGVEFDPPISPTIPPGSRGPNDKYRGRANKSHNQRFLSDRKRMG